MSLMTVNARHHKQSGVIMNSKAKSLIATVLVLVLCVFSSCKRSTARQDKSPPTETSPSTVNPSPSAPLENKASTFGWALQNNQRATLSDYLGKVVVLDFYATWCEPCRDETPHLVQLQRKYEQQGLQIIGLNVGGEDDREEVPNFAKEFEIQYPLGFPDDELVNTYLGDDQRIPQTFVFDQTGQLVKRFVGYDEQDGGKLERVVRATLGMD
jgi:thiol-disulfide isomerase/thioredoxin